MKKILLVLIAVTMLCTMLVACKSDDETAGAGLERVTIKVWVTEDELNITQNMADAFTESYGTYSVTIEIEAVEDINVFDKISSDPAGAADVFALTNDALRDFVSAGFLHEVVRNADDIKERNTAGSVLSATQNGRMWAYPLSAEDGYILYYDKEILTEDDVQTLDGLLASADEAGMKVSMNLYSNGWYAASFFIGAGGTLSIGTDGRQVCDFNNERGLAAAGAVRAFTTHSAYIDGNDDVLINNIGGTIAAGVSSIQVAADISAVLGRNFGAVKLPEFTITGEDGEQAQMGSFGTFRLIGVSSKIADANSLAAAMDFADFLTNEQNQVSRFNSRTACPSNKNAAARTVVQDNAAITALALQSEYAMPQNDILGSFWAPMGAFGAAMVNGETADLSLLLDNMVAQIQS